MALGEDDCLHVSKVAMMTSWLKLSCSHMPFVYLWVKARAGVWNVLTVGQGKGWSVERPYCGARQGLECGTSLLWGKARAGVWNVLIVGQGKGWSVERPYCGARQGLECGTSLLWPSQQNVVKLSVCCFLHTFTHGVSAFKQLPEVSF